MTDKEKMQYVIDNMIFEQTSVKEIITKYLSYFPISLIELYNLIETLQNGFLSPMMRTQAHNNQIARENAYYVECYLKGELYANEEDAKKCLPLQIEHIEKVTKLLKEK
jgi:hypothetical protein